MKALFLCHQYWPFLCGSGIFFQEMAERLVREGNEVTVFTTDALHFERFISPHGKRAARLREVHNGVSIRRFRLRHLPRHAALCASLRKAPFRIAPYFFGTGLLPGMALECLRRHPVDVVHGGLVPYGMLLYLAHRIAAKERVPLLYSPFVHTGEPHDNHVLTIHTNPHHVRLMREANAVIAQTIIEATELERHGISCDKVHVIGMGVNPGDVRGGDGNRFRARHGTKGTVLFSVGPKAYDKGAQQTVMALGKLLDRGYDVSLVLAGPTFANFSAFYGKLPSSTRDRIILIERIEGEEKRDLFADGHIMVMPSRNESFGMVYLEAWACGIPVVGAVAGGVPAVIEDGTDGLLVPFGDSDTLADALSRLLDNPAGMDAMGRQGHKKLLEKYTWDIQYDKLKLLYNRLGLSV